MFQKTAVCQVPFVIKPCHGPLLGTLLEGESLRLGIDSYRQSYVKRIIIPAGDSLRHLMNLFAAGSQRSEIFASQWINILEIHEEWPRLMGKFQHEVYFMQVLLR